jgi:hypothetical protein
MSAVVIGMDPHKRSATIEVMDSDEAVLGGAGMAPTCLGTGDAPGGPALAGADLGHRGMPGHRPAHRPPAYPIHTMPKIRISCASSSR